MGSIVYHYTDAQAFAGMVQNTALWATDFRYLNDSRELIYVWEPFVAKLKELAPTPGEYSDAYKAQLEALRLMNSTDLMAFDETTFVACFTELADAVSQWSRYGANGHGIALGFDTEAINTLKAPVVRHFTHGRIDPITYDNTHEPVTQTGFLQKVGYGDAHRDTVVNGLINNVRDNCGKNGGDFNTMVANSITAVHAWLKRLPLAKHDAFKDEQEHRVTLSEHHGGRSAMQRTALASLGERFIPHTKGPLDTLDVKFRSGGGALFRPYVEIPFPHEALVKVVTGPSLKHHLTEPTVRRLLDRHGFRHTTIEASTLPYQA